MPYKRQHSRKTSLKKLSARIHKFMTDPTLKTNIFITVKKTARLSKDISSCLLVLKRKSSLFQHEVSGPGAVLADSAGIHPGKHTLYWLYNIDIG